MTGEEGQSRSYRPGYEIAAERILEMIVDTGLRPGDRLPTEQDLAASFGLSRSVTREAIKILAAIGRVSAQRGRGLYVGDGEPTQQQSLLGGHRFVPASVEHVQQLLEFRLVQEAYAAGQAAVTATPPDLNRLDLALQDCEAALATGERQLWDDADTRFHLGIAAAARNEFIESAIESARRLQNQVVFLVLHGGAGGSLHAAQHEHVEILNAIRSGEQEAASDAATRHMRSTISGYLDEIAKMLAPSSRASSNGLEK